MALEVIIALYINENNSNRPIGMPDRMPMEENKEKETTAEDVDAGETVNSKEINLIEYSSNLTISENRNIYFNW